MIFKIENHSIIKEKNVWFSCDAKTALKKLKYQLTWLPLPKSDIKQVIEKLWENVECPPLILIGHSMGGALAVHVAERQYIDSLVALVVIDVVEGSALDALSSMQAYLQGRPKLFNSVEQAIEYR